jgi:hypothetical protein
MMKKDPLKSEIRKLKSLPLESPFGVIDDPPPYKSKKKQKETIYIPEKTSSDVPKAAKLGRLPKEVEKIQGKIDNLVKVPKEQLDQFMQVYTDSSKGIANDFLTRIAPVFLSFEDAMSYSTVALRDCLSYDGEIDLEILPLLEWAARISVLATFLDKLGLPYVYKKRFMQLSIAKAVEKAFLTKNSMLGTTVGISAQNRVAGIVNTPNKTTTTPNVPPAAIRTRNLNTNRKTK